MLYLGTSGFSYDDWVGPVYPPPLPKREWLAYYAREFNSCEINSTYYAIPSPQMVKGLMSKVGEDFVFVMKANQAMTHQTTDNENVFKDFLEALKPVTEGGKLGCILYQFSNSFRCTRTNVNYIKTVRQRMGNLPGVVEFRNSGWVRPEVYQLLRDNNLGYCCVDEPKLAGLMPPAAIATSSTGYIRFHGRNAAKWYDHEQAYERYDYSYSAAELAEWVPRIKEIREATENTFIFANNHYRGQAVNTIRQLKMLLD